MMQKNKLTFNSHIPLFFFVICLILFYLSGCSRAPKEDKSSTKKNESIIIMNPIDDAFLSRLKSRKPTTKIVVVVSFGGRPSAGIKIAREIFDNRLNIIVAEVCMSACAEYILPAAKEIKLIDEPLIGYHWNPLMLGHLLRTNATRDLEYCTRIGDDELLKLLSDTGKKTDAWKHTLKRMKLTKYKVDYKVNECPWAIKKFENAFWFPTTGQLKDIFGLTVSGKLCADNPECYEKKIPHYFDEGGKYIVGNEQIIVPKPSERDNKQP